MKSEKGVKVTSRCGNKSGPKQVVGTIDIEIFESISEAVQFVGSEEKVLGLINTQWGTCRKNDARKMANTTISDKRVHDLAIEALLADSDALVAIATAGADAPAKKAELIAAFEAKIRADFETKKAGAAVDAEEENDEDEAKE